MLFIRPNKVSVIQLIYYYSSVSTCKLLFYLLNFIFRQIKYPIQFIGSTFQIFENYLTLYSAHWVALETLTIVLFVRLTGGHDVRYRVEGIVIFFCYVSCCKIEVKTHVYLRNVFSLPAGSKLRIVQVWEWPAYLLWRINRFRPSE